MRREIKRFGIPALLLWQRDCPGLLPGKEAGRATRPAPFAFRKSNSQKEHLIESFD